MSLGVRVHGQHLYLSRQGRRLFRRTDHYADSTLNSNGAWYLLWFQALADVSGDGIADLVVIEAHSGSGFVMLGTAMGSSRSPARALTP